jgi:hypothetical protein
MGCCGQKRAALRSRLPERRPPEPASSNAAAAGDGAAGLVEYRGDLPVLVRVAGGRLYTFSPGRRLQSVPAPDAEELLRNPLFRLDERRPDGTEQERT